MPDRGGPGRCRRSRSTSPDRPPCFQAFRLLLGGPASALLALPHRRAARASASGPCPASCALVHGQGPVHGIVRHFVAHPPPPRSWLTASTIGCPPALTVTRSTCCPGPGPGPQAIRRAGCHRDDEPGMDASAHDGGLCREGAATGPTHLGCRWRCSDRPRAGGRQRCSLDALGRLIRAFQKWRVRTALPQQGHRGASCSVPAL